MKVNRSYLRIFYKTYQYGLPHFDEVLSHAIDLRFIYVTWSSDRDGWFRLFGSWYGISWKHKANTLLFSERSGHTKLYRIGNYNFKILKT